MAKKPKKPVKAAKPKKSVKSARRPAAKPTKPVLPPTPAQASALDFLRQLSETVGVSGDEGGVRKFIRETVKDLADEIKVDTIGNLFAIKHGPQRAPRVLVTAHMDEIGFMILGLDGDGLLRFGAVGGVDDRILLGKPVWVGENKVPGVIGMKPIHLINSNEISSVVKIDSLRIDIGATSREATSRMAKAGDRATFAASFIDLGATVRGKAFDDRAGCAALVEILRGKNYPVELIAAFTVQEEVGVRGAKVAAYAADADAAIVIDCTPANDLPPADEEDENFKYNTRLGHGPAIYTHDGSTLHDKRLIKYLAATAESKNIPYQFRQPGGGGTDAAAIQRSRAGVPTVSVSVPGRYIHSPAAILSTNDFHNTARLVRAALENWDAKVLKR
ncbi:MAG TPA: M20/M25/M40 family metallo-hydrolase [Anaerolineales bacterium]|nr:M20/M25/M40 family metallo-hydrolase [Anaerolineales bacterium]HLF02999.1 M20/M25/M40 family metallo-hydrolase [Anaerolineales bacterium]